MKSNISCQLSSPCQPTRIMQEEPECPAAVDKPAQNTGGTCQGKFPEEPGSFFLSGPKSGYYQEWSPIYLKPPIHVPCAVYHVIIRGKSGVPVFLKDQERYRYYLFMQKAVKKFHCSIHSFCFMTNHIHLVLQIDDIPLSQIIQNLSLEYNEWINCTRRRTGNLFQGGYRSIMLDADAYLGEIYY